VLLSWQSTRQALAIRTIEASPMRSPSAECSVNERNSPPSGRVLRPDVGFHGA
jgi:hypothetical protein